MENKLFKRLLLILLTILIMITSIPLQVFASTDKATTINSQTLFEASTLDDLEMNITNLPTITVTGSEKYKINTSNTTPVTIGSINYTKNINIIFDCAFNKKLDCTVTAFFDNCGTLDGKAIDMKLTYTNLFSAAETGSTRYDTKCLWWTAYGTPEQQTNNNEWFQVGFLSYNLTVNFYEHNSDKIIHLDNAYLTLYSEDGTKDNNGKLIHSEASNSGGVASNVYLYENTNMKYYPSYAILNYTYKDVYYGTAGGSTGAKDKNAICYQYENKDFIYLNIMILEGQWSCGYHLNFIPLTAVIPTEPIKTVSSDKATNNTQLQYIVEQQIPKKYDTSFYLEEVSFLDQIDSSLKFQSISVLNNQNQDITSIAGTYNFEEKNNTIQYDFNKTFLKNNLLYEGESIYFVVNTTTTDKIDVTKVSNNAKVILNKEHTLMSNNVDTIIYYPVTVNYIDEFGNKLIDSVSNNYEVLSKYTTEAKEFNNYELISIPINKEGIITNSSIIVDYIYRLKDASVVTNYLDEKGNKLSDSIITGGKVFDEYTTEEKNFYGYELIEVPSNAKGTMTEDTIVVNYIYRLKGASVVTNYLDEKGNKISESITTEGKVFDEYTTEEKSISGYKLIAIPINFKGIMTEDTIIVNYVYTKKQSSVVANYIDEEGKQLSESEIIAGNVNDNYNTTIKEIYGYKLISVPANAKGRMTEDTIVVNYIYRLKDTSVVTNYIDEKGNKLSESITTEGKVFDEYTTEEKNFYGYELTAVPSNAKGTMTEDTIVVNYIYRLKDASVVTNYIDEKGNKLSESITTEGKIFDEYTTEEKNFYGYELTAVPLNAKGTMTEDTIVVNYIYRLKDTSVVTNYLDEKGNKLSESIITGGKVFDEYTTEEKNFYGYELTAVPSNAKGTMTEDTIVVNYIYRLKDTSVITNYLDESGNKLTDSITTEGKVFDKYTTENKTFYGYELTALPSNANGTMTEDTIVVDYIYRLKDATVTVNYIDTEGNTLAESDVIEGKVFDEYVTNAKEIRYYSLTAVPNNAVGTMTEEGIIVDYIYSQNENTVTINYLEKNTNKKLADTVVFNYLQGNEYDVNSETDKNIKYYSINAVRGDEVKGIIECDKVINVYYTRNQNNIIINFIDWITKEVISPFISKTQDQGTDYNVADDATKDIPYYTYYDSEGNLYGVLEKDETINSYYVRNENNITIKYVEKGTEKQLADTVTYSVFQGTNYDVTDTANKEFACYKLDSIKGLTKGFITEDVEITVYYTTKDTDVVIKYLDINGKTLANSETINGKVFDEYTTEAKKIYGYKLTAIPYNAVGEMAENSIIVIYVYDLKDTSVVATYKDTDGNNLTDAETINGKVFDNYTTENKEFSGYELTAVPSNANGTMTEEIITVDYIYRLKDTTVTANYIDTEGKELAESDVIKGKVFDEYTTIAKSIYGYELIIIPENANGTMTEDAIVLDYIYSLKDTSVIANYITETGETLADSIIIEGKVFENYNTEQMEFYGYELIEVPENATGEMVEDVITVDYIYKLKEARVNVKYVDTEGKELAESIVIDGKVFDEYVTEQKNITDYDFVKATPNITGTMTEEEIEVVYTYTRTVLNEIEITKTEKPVKQPIENTPVEVDIVDTGDINNIVKLAIMSVLLIVCVVVSILVNKKRKENNTKTTN